ncbi:MAG: class GN sortase [Pseudomonadota bacterium]
MILNRVASYALLLCGLLLCFNSFYLIGKAQLAQILIARSWQASLNSQIAVRPWSWADTYAKSKLSFTRLNTTQYVMADASGESLAFGPGFVNDDLLEQNGLGTVIAGHRDSHFAVLRDLRVGDELTIENMARHNERFRVSSLHVIDSEKETLPALSSRHMLLLTCFPFDDLNPNGPLRYLVVAEKIDG